MTYNLDFGVKKAVKEWLNNCYENWVKQPIEKKTEELENLISQQVNKASQIASTHSQKAKETAYKPIGFYQSKPTFHRGLFWIAIGLLIILWILSGS